ncbi:hypothetical protein V6N13_110123 [Hibiscus sabdariffa]
MRFCCLNCLGMWSIDLAMGDLKHFRAVGFQERGFINMNRLTSEMKDDLEAPITGPITSGFGDVKDESCKVAMRRGDVSASSKQTMDPNPRISFRIFQGKNNCNFNY